MSEKIISTLTAPEDRVGATRTTILNPESDDFKEALTPAETREAVKELYDTNMVTRFPRVERRFADEPEQNQIYGLISFVPAKGATPNENGVFGFAKLRGNYPSIQEATLRAQTIIRKTDSYHKIYTSYVGRPFPITLS